MKSVKQFLTSLLSRKFMLAVVAAIVAFGNSYFDWGLDPNEVWAVIIPILAFIGVEGWADVKRAEK